MIPVNPISSFTVSTATITQTADATFALSSVTHGWDTTTTIPGANSLITAQFDKRTIVQDVELKVKSGIKTEYFINVREQGSGVVINLDGLFYSSCDTNIEHLEA